MTRYTQNTRQAGIGYDAMCGNIGGLINPYVLVCSIHRFWYVLYIWVLDMFYTYEFWTCSTHISLCLCWCCWNSIIITITGNLKTIFYILFKRYFSKFEELELFKYSIYFRFVKKLYNVGFCKEIYLLVLFVKNYQITTITGILKSTYKIIYKR